MGILEIEGITKSFGGFSVLNGVDMRVEEADTTILIGPNGSGKSTLINVITGLVKPDKGKILFGGRNVTGWPSHRLFDAGVARTFQIPHPFQKLTVLENLLTAWRKNRGESFLQAPFKNRWVEEEEEAAHQAALILRALNLDKVWDQKASDLSGGQTKLVEVGRALMSGAKILLMDEPIGGINLTLADDIFSSLRKLNKELGVTLLIIEHRLDVALQYVDHVYAMWMGRIISEGTPEDVLSDPRVIDSYLGR